MSSTAGNETFRFRLRTKLKLIIWIHFYFSKAKSRRFSNFINIHRPFGKAQKSALGIGIVIFFSDSQEYILNFA